MVGEIDRYPNGEDPRENLVILYTCRKTDIKFVQKDEADKRKKTDIQILEVPNCNFEENNMKTKCKLSGIF